MTDMLQEFCDSRGVSMRVDRQAGVIRGVKVLGLESRNGRTYLPEALAQAAQLYEDAKVNVNHPEGQSGRAARLPGPHRHDSPRDRTPRRGSFWRLPLQPQARPGRAIGVGRRARAGERGLFAQRRGAGRPARRSGGCRGDYPRAERRPGGRPGHDARPVRVGGRGNRSGPLFRQAQPDF